MKQSACSAVICQPSGHKQKHNNHMEFHPMLGKEKKGTSYRLHKHNVEDMDASMAPQMKYLSPDDIEMLRQGNGNNSEKIFKCEQHKAPNKEIWSRPL